MFGLEEELQNEIEQLKTENKNLKDKTKVLERSLKLLQSFHSVGCKCKEDDKHGWTEIKCCNECGKPIEHFWIKTLKE